MRNPGNGVWGAVLIGAGIGLAVVGVSMLVPTCANWAMDSFDEAVRRGRDTLNTGVESAASLAGNISGVAQRKFSEASKVARERTAKAAGAVENAARHVREYAESEAS
jgi:hypothetical protein